MLDDFVEANSSTGKMQQYIDGGLPNNAYINEILEEYYNGVITISDSQIILWYKFTSSTDSSLTRNYTIMKDSTTLFNGSVELPACTYHLDGIVVNISDLGTVIPSGTAVTVTNTAEVNGQSADETTTIVNSSDITAEKSSVPTSGSTIKQDDEIT